MERTVCAEYKMWMHCNACEQTVAKIISKFEGVEYFVTNMNANTVVVKGSMDPAMLRKKLKKKTGKAVELVNVQDESESKSMLLQPMTERQPYFSLCREGEAFLHIFSDDNPNACSIM